MCSSDLKQGLAGDTGQDMNYLIHALLRRGREEDLSRAEQLLGESKTIWAPRERAESHLTFCLHYEAELARLRQQRFTPPHEAPYSESWSHAYAFALLSCARNRAHSTEERLAFLERAMDFGKKGRNPLFQLFHLVYGVYYAGLSGSGAGLEAVRGIGAWCEARSKEGAPGWARWLGPCLEQHPGMAEQDWAEGLMGRIPYF